jgi:hypothetical protein
MIFMLATGGESTSRVDHRVGVEGHTTPTSILPGVCLLGIFQPLLVCLLLILRPSAPFVINDHQDEGGFKARRGIA